MSRSDFGRPHHSVVSTRPARDSRKNHLAVDPAFVEEFERRQDGLRRGAVPETVCDVEPPVPVVFGVRVCEAGRQVERRFDVAGLVRDPQVDLQVGPVIRLRVEDRLEVVGEAHQGQA